MKLHEVNEPGKYKVTSIHVGKTHARELSQLGILPGAVIHVLHNDFCGTLGVQLDGELIILGRSETFHIQVASCAEAESQIDSRGAPRR